MNGQESDSSIPQRILAMLPASISLPAGTGKTELIAQIALEIRKSNQSALILTHTNAGVDVLRKRCTIKGASSPDLTIKTIDSWTLEFIRNRPISSGMILPDEPVWSQMPQYHRAAVSSMKNQATSRIVENSYDYLLVDEYQDCSVYQHALIGSIAKVVPTLLLGDPLQGLFDFYPNEPISWDQHVVPDYPDIPLSSIPWRWKESNPELGDWLLKARVSLQRGFGVDVRTGPIEWLQTKSHLEAVAHLDRLGARFPNLIALDRFPQDIISLSRGVEGRFRVMEDIAGKRMMEFARILDALPAHEVASAIVEFVDDCTLGAIMILGWSERSKIAAGSCIEPSSELKNFDQVNAINKVLQNPSAINIYHSLIGFFNHDRFILCRHEAWKCIVDAISMVVEDATLTYVDAVKFQRDSIRFRGRAKVPHVLSRPLLVKGLEFRNVAVVSAERYSYPELYVGMTRAIENLIVLSPTPMLRPTSPR